LFVSSESWYDSAITRLTAAGTLDTTFGSTGTVFTQSIILVDSVVLQSDNKILVGGVTDSGEPMDYDMALLRLNTDGSFDTSFGTGGVASFDSGFNGGARVYEVLVVGGQIWLLGGWCSAYRWRESVSGFCRELREPVVSM
jgi:uncharacterized delta-60 repeat protein